MGRRIRISILIWVAAAAALCAQEVRVRPADRIEMPSQADSNSPAFWRDGQLNWFNSTGHDMLSTGPDIAGPWSTSESIFLNAYPAPHWIESVWAEDDNTLWCWYHAEPVGLFPDSQLTAPRIGAGVSTDGGRTFLDLGIILESGDPLDGTMQNGFFAGGHGDCSVILSEDKTYFYFFFGNYGGPAGRQGVAVARMAFADRFNPAGAVWKYDAGAWDQPGIGGSVTPIFPVARSWRHPDPDAFWGPSVHWNTHLQRYVMLLNHARGLPGWAQEGIYVSFSSDLSNPATWAAPKKILDASDLPAWSSFYPQVMGMQEGGTDARASRTARLFVNGVSTWEVDFIRPTPPPPPEEQAPDPESPTLIADPAPPAPTADPAPLAPAPEPEPESPAPTPAPEPPPPAPDI